MMFITFLLLFQSVYAVDLLLSQKSVTAYTGESVELKLTIKNDGDTKQRFMLSVFPQFNPNVNVNLEKYTFEIEAGEEEITTVYFIIPECAEEISQIFTFTVKSLTEEENKDTETLNLNIIRKYQVCISEFRIDKQVLYPEESMKIEISLSNPSSTLSLPFSVETSIKKDREIIKSFIDRIEAIEPKSTKTIEHVYEIEKYESPGYYEVEVRLKDHLGRKISTKKTQFRVGVLNASENPSLLKTVKSITHGLISQVVEIRIKNEGNVPTAPFTISESVPIFMKNFFIPKVEPDAEEEKENRVIYSWYIEKLEPGEEVVITYEISAMSAVLAFLGVVGIVVVIFLYTFSLKVVKKASIKKGKIITVMLEVKNKTRKEIRNVIIMDFVPNIAKVVEKFDTLRPKIRKVKGGTELVWKIDVLRPMEERIITYRIKPKIEIVGKLKLPPAHLKVFVGKKEVKKIISKSVFLEMK